MQMASDALVAVFKGYGPRVTQVVFKPTRLASQNGFVEIEAQFSWDDVNPRTKTPLPYKGREVYLYREGLLMRKEMGKAVTSDQGYCSFVFPKPNSFFQKHHMYSMELTNDAHPHARQGLWPWARRGHTVVDQIFQFMLGENETHVHAELTATYALHPRDITNIPSPPMSQWPSLPYFVAMAKATGAVIFVAAFVDMVKKYLTSTQIQTIYDTFTKKHPKVALTPENLIYWLLNGILRGGKVTRDGSHIVWEANYDKSVLSRPNSWPNVEVHADLDKDLKGKAQLEKIVIKLRNGEEQVVRLGDKDLERAIAIAMTSFGFKGQADEKGHLPEGHIIPGNIAVPFFKHVSPANPIYRVLAPFLREVGFINYISAQNIIFGAGSGLSSAGLPPEECDKVLIEAVKVLANWKKYTIEEEIGDEDYFARCEKFAYTELYKYYRKFLVENWAAVDSYWNETCTWSDVVNDHILEFPRVTENVSDPTFEDLEKLTHVLAWIAVKTSVKHWIMHTRQKPFTDIHTLSLGMQNLALDDKGDFAKDLNTPVHDANLQNLITRSLVNAELPTILENRYKDIPEDLYAVLVRIIHFCEENGYPDAKGMTHLTNI